MFLIFLIFFYINFFVLFCFFLLFLASRAPSPHSSYSQSPPRALDLSPAPSLCRKRVRSYSHRRSAADFFLTCYFFSSSRSRLPVHYFSFFFVLPTLSRKWFVPGPLPEVRYASTQFRCIPHIFLSSYCYYYYYFFLTFFFRLFSSIF